MAAYTKEDVLEFVEENDVKFIRLSFCDLFGNQKNISIQPHELKNAFENGIQFDSFLVSGYDDTTYQDLYLLPDPKTMNILPWRPMQGKVMRLFCNIVNSEGEPFPYDARYFLQQTLRECHKMGFVVRIGLKSEFYLFKTDENGNPTDEPLDNGGYMDIAPLDRGENVRRDICLTLDDMGIRPDSSHHEAGPGQNEIDFMASDAMSQADHYITYRQVVGAIASRNGVYASFDPKPIADKSGNGLHMAISLYKDGINLEDTNPDMTAAFMAGVFNRMRDITIFLNPQEESYMRFGKNEAPKYITWSTQNRSRLLRVPVVHGRNTCFILRSPDSGINPYLAFAFVIQAGLEGIRNKETLPEPVNVSMRKMTESEKQRFDKLPLSIGEAANCARESAFLHSGGRTEIADRFINALGE